MFRRIPSVTPAIFLVLFSASAAIPAWSLTDSSPTFLKPREAARLLMEKPEPEYPPLAKQNYIQGRVKIRVLVNREGKIAEAHVLNGHPFLAAAGLAALGGWQYSPYVTPKGPEPFVTDVQMVFSLRIRDLNSVPNQPEQDLKRQVRPPRVLSRPAAAGRPDNLPRASSIHIRVLVSADGKALDVDPAPGFPAKFADMRESFADWKFQPARFGSLDVPWYLDVEIPSESWPQAPAGSG